MALHLINYKFKQTTKVKDQEDLIEAKEDFDVINLPADLLQNLGDGLSGKSEILSLLHFPKGSIETIITSIQRL